MSNENQVKKTAFRLAFLMPHTAVNIYMIQEATDCCIVYLGDPPQVNKESDEYIAGAKDAFKYFIQYLQQKGPPTK